MVSKASEDLPEPESPVNTTSWSRGISTIDVLEIVLARAADRDHAGALEEPAHAGERRGRLLSKRSFMRSVGAVQRYRAQRPDAAHRRADSRNVVRTGVFRQCEMAAVPPWRLWTTYRAGEKCVKGTCPQ